VGSLLLLSFFFNNAREVGHSLILPRKGMILGMLLHVVTSSLVSLLFLLSPFVVFGLERERESFFPLSWFLASRARESLDVNGNRLLGVFGCVVTFFF
jgi:hypothetical protein